MPGLNAHLGTTDLETWHSGVWVCPNGHYTESVDRPDYGCDRYDPPVCGEWTECVLAARYPREGEWGIITCGRCGEELIERNSEGVIGWHCNDCGGQIIPRSTPVRPSGTGESIETEQVGLESFAPN